MIIKNLLTIFNALLLSGCFLMPATFAIGEESESAAFTADVLPLLRKNCIACHNAKTAEGGLSLESVEAILKGGDSGAMVDLKEPHYSLLLQRARGEVDEIMPPEDNSVGAVALAKAELALIERWIASGAKADVEMPSAAEAAAAQIEWQSLPEVLRSVYSLATSPTDGVVAVGRGNSIIMVEPSGGAVLHELYDAGLSERLGTKAAHVDFVNSLVFSPDGTTLVSGGFRTLKVWRKKVDTVPLGDTGSLVQALLEISKVNADVPVSDAQKEQVRAWFIAADVSAGKSADEIELARWQVDLERQRANAQFLSGLVGPATERVTKEEEAKKKTEEAHQKQVEDVAAKRMKFDEAQAKLVVSEDSPELSDEQKAAIQKEIDEAQKALDASEKQLMATAQAVAAAVDVLQRASNQLALLNAEVSSDAAVGEGIAAKIQTRQSAISAKQVLQVAFNADQSLAAAVISDATVAVFDVASGRGVRRLSVQGLGEGFDLRFAGHWLIAQWSDATARRDPLAWNLDGGWQLDLVIGSPSGQSPFVDRITSLDFSPDGTLLIVGGGEPSRTGVVTVLETKGYEVVSNWDQNHSDIVLALKVSPDGSQLASTGADKQIRIVDFPTGENMRSLEGHTHHVLGLAWHNHGRRLASVSADKTIKVWNVRAGEAERTIAGGSKELTGVDFVGLSTQIAVASGEGAVRIYNTDDGNQVRSFAKTRGFQQAVSVDPSGKWVTAGSDDGSLRVWPVEATEPNVIID